MVVQIIVDRRETTYFYCSDIIEHSALVADLITVSALQDIGILRLAQRLRKHFKQLAKSVLCIFSLTAASTTRVQKAWFSAHLYYGFVLRICTMDLYYGFAQ